MEGEEKEVAMQEIRTKEEPEISLEEALGRKPQGFEMKKENLPRKEEITKTDKNEKISPKPTLQDIIAKKIVSKDQSDHSEKKSDHLPKSLSPGKVVKF